MPVWLEHAVERVAGAGDTTRRVRWRANGRSFDFDVPGDNVWVCIKDDLLLREYEWLGIDLGQYVAAVLERPDLADRLVADASDDAADIS